MENDREARELLLNLGQDVECQWRRNEQTSLRVACALVRSELVCTVRSTDRDRERVATGTCSEVDYFLRLCVV